MTIMAMKTRIPITDPTTITEIKKHQMKKGYGNVSRYFLVYIKIVYVVDNPGK